jgi:radical SAM protein with 4Fe4S-binding SPASM domain
MPEERPACQRGLRPEAPPLTERARAATLTQMQTASAPPEGSPKARPKRYSLAIELTAHCNQKCGYCYNAWRDEPADVGSLPTDELVSLVDRALTELELDHVTLTGGEPFARAGVFDVLDTITRHGLRCIIISNGGVVTPAIAERLAPHRPHFVQITLNGPDEGLHAAHVGEGHWGPTLRGIATLQEHGVNVTGSIVVTRKNARVVGETLALFRSLGVREVALSRYSPAGYAASQVDELLPSRSDLVAALEAAERAGAEHGMGLQVTMPVPPCVIAHEDFPHVRFSSCPIGTEMQELALGPRGELRQCTLHEGVLGDARTESFAALATSEAVMSYRDVTPEFCAPCPFKSTCIGGCGAAAASVSGDARGLDPIVAQHVDDSLSAKLAAARRGAEAFVPANRLVRGARPPVAT